MPTIEDSESNADKGVSACIKSTHHGGGASAWNVQITLMIIAELDGTDKLLGNVVIGTLPDDALLETFSFYVDQALDEDGWHTLVHVCRRWRYIVLSSPQRLNLRVLCTPD